MKLILGVLILITAGLKAANLEDWLESGLLHPDLIASMRDELELTDDQQTKLTAQLGEAREVAEPLELEVKAQKKALHDLLKQPGTGADAAAARLAKLIEAEAAVKQLQLRTLIGVRDLLTPGQRQKARGLTPPKMAVKEDLEAGLDKKAGQLRKALESLGIPPTEAMKERGDDIQALVKSGQFAAAAAALDRLIEDSHFKELEAEPDEIDFTQFEPGSTDLDSLRERYEAVQVAGQQVISLPLVRELLQAKAAFEEAKAAQDAEKVGRILTFVEEKLGRK